VKAPTAQAMSFMNEQSNHVTPAGAASGAAQAAHDIRPIAASDTRWLRHLVLRPHQPPEALVYPGDDDPAGFHAGAFLGERLVGVATVAPEDCPAAPGARGWRLRGMATLHEVRRRGYGAALIAACVAHVRDNGGDVLWCHGRTSALSFYRSLSFERHGDEFEVPYTGPHYLLLRILSD
jgi:GNAT superfamily N-acetyltransferase